MIRNEAGCLKVDLYRGKRLDNGEWIVGSAVWFDENQAFIMPLYPHASSLSYAQLFSLTAVMVDPSTVGRYTTLTDKSGKKIFKRAQREAEGNAPPKEAPHD